MELRQLRYFVAVARELSFTRAAERLHLSQPPLSLQIRDLENELGARLFVRTSRRVEMSEAGRALLGHADAILERVEAARRHVERVAQGLEGQVLIGLAGSHFLGPFPRFIAAYRGLRPGVSVALSEQRPALHIEALREGRVDLSITRGPVDDPAFTSRLLWRDPVVAALPPGHRHGKRKRLRLADLRDDEFVFLRLESSPFAQRLYDACVHAGYRPKIVQQVVEVPAALNLVAAGLGVALVPRSLAATQPDLTLTCALEPGMPSGDVYAVTRRDLDSSVVQQFVGELLAWSRHRP
jgi:DNA-binding transcriptional LysR family regulator